MFKKQFKVKTNNQVKGSDRKLIKENLLKAFPNLTESDVDNVLPRKEAVNSIKILTATNETVQVYTIQKCPVVFEVNGVLFPTTYLLWKFPDLIPSFTTSSEVLKHIHSGADLMMPGVISHGLSKYNLPEGTIAYVNLDSNKAAVAVGTTAQSSSDMISSGRGKCIKIYHVFDDKLYTVEGLHNVHIENLGPPDFLKLTNYEEDFPELGSAVNRSTQLHEVEAQENESIEEVPVEELTNLSLSSSEEMDELLNYCFFVAIKYSKTLTLPILTSNFYKLQMFPVCPQGKSLDIKKSSFKKLKPFLDDMCKQNIITVKEVKKGVESITAINKNHPKFCEFYVDPIHRPKRPEDEETNAPGTSIIESYIITQNVLPIFEESGLKKGDKIQSSEIRKYVTMFVKKNNCQHEEVRFVEPKGVLKDICKTEAKITWEELIERVCNSMKSCYKISSRTEQIENRGKLPSIIFRISQRAGNKKVTLVDNLEAFGIHIPEFAKECQRGIAASTSIITKPVGSKCDQLLVQGNQITFIYQLLTEKYKISPKYIKGLELAPKRKK